MAEHPAPWKWTELGDLEDAFGDFVLWVDEEGQGKADPSFSIGFAFDRTRALIAAAPEMEALLRHIATEVLPFEYGRPDGKEGGIAEAAQEILARINAAKAGE